MLCTWTASAHFVTTFARLQPSCSLTSPHCMHLPTDTCGLSLLHICMNRNLQICTGMHFLYLIMVCTSRTIGTLYLRKLTAWSCCPTACQPPEPAQAPADICFTTGLVDKKPYNITPLAAACKSTLAGLHGGLHISCACLHGGSLHKSFEGGSQCCSLLFTN